jgi:HEAT repeat protein
MGLLELCLLPLLSPQEPAVTPAPEATPPAVSATQASPEDLQDLLTAERAGDKANLVVLRRLTDCTTVPIAARAAWLLGRAKDPRANELCCEVATTSAHVEARVQAMNALMLRKDPNSLASAIAGLQDADRSVRALAAQLLGKLGKPTAVDPLLTMIDRCRTDETTGAATDVQAALVALHDLKAARSLLRAATAIHDSKIKGTGEALAYCFQGLSPTLDQAQEVTTLLAVLDHREPLVRRYAIGRLAQIGDPATAKALEGRLGTESAELRPLVEVALKQVRSDRTPVSTDELERALSNFETLRAMAESKWAAMEDWQRWATGAAPVVLILFWWGFGRLRRRSAARNVAMATAALVAPSEEYLEQMEAQAEEQAMDGENEQQYEGARAYEPHGTLRS